MRILFFLLITFYSVTAQEIWRTDFEKAKTDASNMHKKILLSFSGSDWCIPCIKMEETFFEHASFKEYADEHLILLKADFPRLKKNQLSPKLTKQNEKLAEKYNTEGVFPLTLILGEDGKIIQKFEGLPKGTVDSFIEILKNKNTNP